jgi:Tol biopolymer transport system component
MNERGIAFSPDGNELYFTLLGNGFSVILWMRQVDGVWMQPEVAPFSGVYNDQDPAFSPDGQRLFFASIRPLKPGEPVVTKYRLFYMQREGDSWGEPQSVGEAVNQQDYSLNAPTVAADGTLFFTIMNPDSLGGSTIYRSRWVNEAYQPPENLSEALATLEGRVGFNYLAYPYIAPDQSYIIYQYWTELFISWQQTDGT